MFPPSLSSLLTSIVLSGKAEPFFFFLYAPWTTFLTSEGAVWGSILGSVVPVIQDLHRLGSFGLVLHLTLQLLNHGCVGSISSLDRAWGLALQVSVRRTQREGAGLLMGTFGSGLHRRGVNQELQGKKGEPLKDTHPLCPGIEGQPQPGLLLSHTPQHV